VAGPTIWSMHLEPVPTFDLVAIGSGPGGQRAAVAAAKLGYRAAVVDRRGALGGVSLNTGTIPSKTLREAVLHVRAGRRWQESHGPGWRDCGVGGVDLVDLVGPVRQVHDREAAITADQLERNGVHVLDGWARFVDPSTLAVVDGRGDERRVRARTIVIATGTRPARPADVPFDGRVVIDADALPTMTRVPRSLVVVGGGVIGLEYASMFAALGTAVTVVDQRTRLLEFCDAEIVDALVAHLSDLGVVLRLGEEVAAVERRADRVIATLGRRGRLVADTILYSAGRQGVTEGLALEAAGLTADRRGRIAVDADQRTAVPHIYAVGDVVGFPALAATAMEQGRRAAHHALGEPLPESGALLPIGIYTVPEISYVGRTEEELTAAGIPYERGVARSRELARGQIAGDVHGLLKLLVATDDRRVLGVHAFGAQATEIVHIGQAVMALGGTVDYFLETVFNYPTWAEAYKVAALNVVNKLREVARVRAA
jgi:NAD(P) transhydrogenase